MLVRKAAVHVIGEIINVSRDTNIAIIEAHALQMAERLKERVDTCKIAIFEVLSSMLIDNNPSISEKKK